MGEKDFLIVTKSFSPDFCFAAMSKLRTTTEAPKFRKTIIGE